MKTWSIWFLSLGFASVLLPIVFGELAVLLRIFDKDPDSVERSDRPGRDDEPYFEADHLEPQEE